MKLVVVVLALCALSASGQFFEDEFVDMGLDDETFCRLPCVQHLFNVACTFQCAPDFVNQLTQFQAQACTDACRDALTGSSMEECLFSSFSLTDDENSLMLEFISGGYEEVCGAGTETPLVETDGAAEPDALPDETETPSVVSEPADGPAVDESGEDMEEPADACAIAPDASDAEV